MKFIKGLGLHLFLITVTVILIVTTVSYVLNSYTRHGQSLTVPDIRGINIKEAARILSEKKLRLAITDSLYFPEKPPLSVIEQNPVPQSNVKEGRIIYVSVNANSAPTVLMPNLIDISMRQASTLLLSAGLRAGKLIYKPDIAQNVVLEMLYRGQPIKADTKIPKGSVIDLILGDGLEGAEVPLPDLTGLTIEEAGNLLSSSSLNLGKINYSGLITDSFSVKVFRQEPPFSEGKMVKGGYSVDLFLKQ